MKICHSHTVYFLALALLYKFSILMAAVTKTSGLNCLVSLKGIVERIVLNGSPQLNVSRADQCENPGSLPRTEPQIYRQVPHRLAPSPSPTFYSSSMTQVARWILIEFFGPTLNPRCQEVAEKSCCW